MALKNPRPIGLDGIGALPDGQFTSVSERINRTGLAYLGKRTGKDASVTLTYTNRRGESRSLNARDWLKKYNEIYFNPIGHRPQPHATTVAVPAEVPNRPHMFGNPAGDHLVSAGQSYPAVRIPTGLPNSYNRPASVMGWSAFGVQLWIVTGICAVIGLGLFYSGYLAAGG